MRKKLRHSKFKNTGILFELLIKQITADILAGKEDSDAKGLLFKYFKENTELSKEWKLYDFLLTEKIKDVSHAERFLTTVIEQRKKLSNKKLELEKFNLIKEMKLLYPIDQFLKSSIKNYKLLASVYKLFEQASSDTIKFDVREIFQAKNSLVENISSVAKPNTEEDDIIEFYKKQSEDIRLLSYKLLVENVNRKYSNLDDDQKLVLREFINNVSNTNHFGEFVCQKIDEVRNTLNDLTKLIMDNDVIKIKIQEVTHQLSKLKPVNGIVKDNQIMSLLLSYELIREIKCQLQKEEAPNE